MTVDSIITRITEAPDTASALAALKGIPRPMLATVADQLYIDDYDMSSATVKRAIVKEARA